MEKKLRYYTVIGAIFTSIAGTLLHFTYGWSGNNFWVGLFSPVSESTWEHMKLLFFPMLLYSIFSCILLSLAPSQSRPGERESHLTCLKNSYPCLCSGNALGILLGTFSIPVLFYTYSGILGTHFLFLDIAVFLISVALGFACSYHAAKSCAGKKISGLLQAVLALLLLCFFLFSVHAPGFGIFISGD